MEFGESNKLKNTRLLFWHMQAIIMAAGMGTRMGDLTNDTPKPLIPIKGVPLLKRQLDALLKIPEISEIIIITGHKADIIKNYVESNYKQSKIKLIHNEEYNKGAVVTLSKAEPYIKEGFLVMNVDHLFSSKAYKKVIKETKQIMVCFFTNRPSYEDERRIKVYPGGKVEVSKGLKDYDYGYTGLVAVGPKYKEEYFKCANEMIAANNHHFHPDDLILPLSEKGIPIQLCDLSKYTFIEIDTPEDYKQAEEKIHLLEAEDK